MNIQIMDTGKEVSLKKKNENKRHLLFWKNEASVVCFQPSLLHVFQLNEEAGLLKHHPQEAVHLPSYLNFLPTK